MIGHDLQESRHESLLFRAIRILTIVFVGTYSMLPEEEPEGRERFRKLHPCRYRGEAYWEGKI
jgi:hypothetical protein